MHLSVFVGSQKSPFVLAKWSFRLCLACCACEQRVWHGSYIKKCLHWKKLVLSVWTNCMFIALSCVVFISLHASWRKKVFFSTNKFYSMFPSCSIFKCTYKFILGASWMQFLTIFYCFCMLFWEKHSRLCNHITICYIKKLTALCLLHFFMALAPLLVQTIAVILHVHFF